MINDETSRQEVSSTTDIKEKPSSTTDVKESNGQDEKQSREENDKGKKDEEASLLMRNIDSNFTMVTKSLSFSKLCDEAENSRTDMYVSFMLHDHEATQIVQIF